MLYSTEGAFKHLMPITSSNLGRFSLRNWESMTGKGPCADW